MVQLWSPEKFQRDNTTSDPSATDGPSGKATGSEGQEFNNAIDPNRCLRPLQRARDRRAARLKEESHADVEFGDELLVDPDHRSFECKPQVPAVKRGDRCWVCNEVAADVDWYQHDWHEDIAICMPCIDNTEKGRSFLQFCKIEFEERQNSQ